MRWGKRADEEQGQGPNQQRLAAFCQDTTLDIIPIGFVNVFPDQQNGPGSNYGNACGSPAWVSPSGEQTQMLTYCSQIEEDIKVCQAAGKKIFASLGGDSPGNLLASADSARSFADFLYGTFGPQVDPTHTLFPRPFGDTVIDGVDLDIESGPPDFYSDLVNELRTKFAGSGRSFQVSAAPQCFAPDAPQFAESHLQLAIANSAIDYL
jgi:chitinase